MTLRIQCSACDSTLKVPDELRGKTVRCPRCKEAVRIPASPPSKEPSRPTTQAPKDPRKGATKLGPTAKPNSGAAPVFQDAARQQRHQKQKDHSRSAAHEFAKKNAPAARR